MGSVSGVGNYKMYPESATHGMMPCTDNGVVWYAYMDKNLYNHIAFINLL